MTQNTTEAKWVGPYCTSQFSTLFLLLSGYIFEIGWTLERDWYLISKSCHSKTVSTFLCEFVQKTNFNSLGSTDERDLVATLITWGNLWRTDAFISRSFSHMSCCLYLQMSKIFPKLSDNWLKGVQKTHCTGRS
jgi:hypothetical protein